MSCLHVQKTSLLHILDTLVRYLGEVSAKHGFMKSEAPITMASFSRFFFGKNLFICLFVCLTVKEYFYIFVVKTFGNTKGGGKKKNHSQ